MATFGYTTQGTTGTNTLENTIVGSRFTISENGTANSITAYINPGFGSPNLKAAIYSYSDLALVGSTEELTAVSGNGWKTFNFSSGPSLSSGIEYIIVVWSSNTIGTVTMPYDAGTTAQGQHDSQTYGSWPNPLVPSATNDRKYSIYCTYTPSASSQNDDSNLIYRIYSIKNDDINIIYRVGTYNATQFTDDTNILYSITAAPKNIKVYPYDMTRDHSIGYLLYSGSWSLQSSDLDGYMGFSDYKTFGYGYSDIKTSLNANYRIGGNECIRYKFYVDTAMTCERLYLQTGIRSVTARPSDHLNFKLFKGSTVVYNGQFKSTSNIQVIIYSGINDEVNWDDTQLSYEMTVGYYTLALYSTVSSNGKHYHAHVYSLNDSKTSFQGATSSYGYSTDSGKTWSTDIQLYDLPFMLGVRAYSCTVKAANGVVLGGATVYGRSTSYPTWNKFAISDHSGYVEMPLKKEAYNITARKNHFAWHNTYQTYDGKDSSQFNFPPFYKYVTASYNILIGDTSNIFQCNNESLWWGFSKEGTNTSPGMNYPYRSKIIFNTSHSPYTTSQTIDFNMFTGHLNKSPVTDMHYIDGMQTWTYSVVRYKDISHIIYLNTKFNIHAVSYNHINQMWFNTAKYIAPAGSSFDTHFGPSACVDSLGRLHILYGCHHTKMAYIYSSANGDITKWSTPYLIDKPGAAYCSYPSPHFDANNNLYVFFRGSQDAAGTMYFSIIKKDSTGYSLGNWHSAWPIFAMSTSASASYHHNTPSLYNAGTDIDDNGNFHCAVTFFTDYAGQLAKSQGVVYAYSTSNGQRWKDLKKQVSWNAGNRGLGTSLPHMWSYNTVSPVIQSPPTGYEYGGNHNAMCYSVDKATPNSTLNRPFFLYNRIIYGNSSATSWSLSSPQAYIVEVNMAKWTGTTWAHSKISSAFGRTVFSGRYGGGLVMGDNEELITYYGYSQSTSMQWGGGPGVVQCRSLNYGSSWSFYCITAHNEIGQPLINMKRDFSSRQIEAAMSLGNNMYFMKTIKYYPYNHPSGDDVRVVYKNQEIDRVADLWGYENTKVQFRIQNIVPTNMSSATSGYYYVYYGRNQWAT